MTAGVKERAEWETEEKEEEEIGEVGWETERKPQMGLEEG